RRNALPQAIERSGQSLRFLVTRSPNSFANRPISASTSSNGASTLRHSSSVAQCPPFAMRQRCLRVLNWCRRHGELHPPKPILDFPVGPATSAIEAVGAKLGVDIGSEPGSRAAGCPEAIFDELHQSVADALTLVFRKHGDYPQLSR